MKKLSLFAAILLLAQVSFAGGILTNTNQSVQFARMLSRNASTKIDAVYFNPAGIMKMENGFHFGIHNQTIFQTRTITTEASLNRQEYEGDVKAPLFPTAFAVYKMDKLAFSLGFGPNGGGGSADYKNGLPSFESLIADQVNGTLVPGLSGLSAFGQDVQEGYGVDIHFKGQSVFWGFQFGVSAKISDMFSVYGGARYLSAVNNYSGAIENIQLNVNGSLTNAVTFLTDASNLVSNAATDATNAASSLQSLIDGGASAYTLSQVEMGGHITSEQKNTLVQGLLGLGLSQTQIDAMNVAQVQGAYTQGAETLNATSAELAATSVLLKDKELDTEQTGRGITPILGVNIAPTENLNIGIKYEFKTGLKLTNKTDVDDTGFFPDGQKTSSDIPAILAIGANYKISDAFSAQLSYNTYFDKNVNWGQNMYGQEKTIDGNTWEVALGVQYNISDNFAVSLGAMRSRTNVSEQYQSDFSYSNPSYSGGLGFEWKLSEALTLDAGFMATNYESQDKSFGDYSENYDKASYVFALGISYSIFR